MKHLTSYLGALLVVLIFTLGCAQQPNEEAPAQTGNIIPQRAFTGSSE